MLERARAACDATECHGILTGLACGLDEATLAIAAARSLREIDPAIAGDAELVDHLGSVAVRVRDSLDAQDMHFTVLVPEDRPLSERANSLGDWCQGFLYGLGVSQTDLDLLDDIAAEAVEAFSQIANAARGTEDSETVEQAYVELYEFIRVGVQVIFEDVNHRLQEQDAEQE